MEFHQLKTFITVAKTKSVTRAASQLNTTPPSVSNHIRQLEAELGVMLFTRTSRGMQITTQGDRLQSKAQDILTASDEFQKIAKTIHRDVKGHVCLGINADPEYLKLPGIIHALYHQHPGIHLEIVTSSTGEILKWIEAGKLDCGFAFGEHDTPRLVSVFLSGVDLAIAIPARFKEGYETAGLKEIAALPWIFPTHMCPFLNQIKAFLSARGIELKNRVFSNDDITKKAFINQGIAVCVLERQEAMTLADRKKIFLWQGDEAFETTVSFIYSKNRSDDLLINAVTACIRDTWNVLNPGRI